jgi:hypothetical protein
MAKYWFGEIIMPNYGWEIGRNSGVSEQLISYVKTVQDMIYAMLLMPIKSIKN